jgi:hypothetical protein
MEAALNQRTIRAGDLEPARSSKRRCRGAGSSHTHFGFGYRFSPEQGSD